MASRPTIQAAVDRLVARGVTEILAVPLFVSSHSSVVRSTEYLLGLRSEMPPELKIFARMNHGTPAVGHQGHESTGTSAAVNMTPVASSVPIRMGDALNRHPLVAEILASRARAISTTPDTEAVLIVAHGPVPDEDNNRWLEDMTVLAQGVRARATYRSIDVLTIRDDAPVDVRDKATAELRALVTRRIGEGSRVLIVPLLLSYGGIEQGLRKRLDGLDCTMAPQGLMPDERLIAWVRETTKR
jgi:sirohydrochlorin ferrochelatase